MTTSQAALAVLVLCGRKGKRRSRISHASRTICGISSRRLSCLRNRDKHNVETNSWRIRGLWVAATIWNRVVSVFRRYQQLLSITSCPIGSFSICPSVCMCRYRSAHQQHAQSTLTWRGDVLCLSSKNSICWNARQHRFLGHLSLVTTGIAPIAAKRYPYPFICSQNKQEIHMNKIAIEPDSKAQQCTNSCPH